MSILHIFKSFLKKRLVLIALTVLAIVAVIALSVLTRLPSDPSFAEFPSSPAVPVLETLEEVTTNAFGDGDTYVPNSWGAHKNRLVRTSNGSIFTVYTSEGDGEEDRLWHLMRRTPEGEWAELKRGNAGTEPINILRGPNDEIHLFAWPSQQGTLQHLVSTDLGETFASENVPGSWTKDQGYTSTGINAQGNLVVFQTGNDKPGTFLWAYYTAQKQRWQFHRSTIDYRYTYAFFFPGDKNDLTIVAMRDVQRPVLGYPSASGFNYVFNAIKYFYISDINNPQMHETLITEVQPRDTRESAITYLVDSYVDTQGRVHLLYHHLYEDRLHHAIVYQNKLIKDVSLDVELPTKARIMQDTRGHFYILTVSQDGKALNVYPGTEKDTDGTQLASAVKLNIQQFPGCSDYDFCHAPTLALPRNGHALSDTIDGVYGNFKQEIYFRIKLV